MIQSITGSSELIIFSQILKFPSIATFDLVDHLIVHCNGSFRHFSNQQKLLVLIEPISSYLASSLLNESSFIALLIVLNNKGPDLLLGMLLLFIANGNFFRFPNNRSLNYSVVTIEELIAGVTTEIQDM
jgi:hypothetical protein